MKTKSSFNNKLSPMALLRRAPRVQALIWWLLLPGMSQMSTSSVVANPQGGTVVHGDVSFGGSAGNLQIQQKSANAIINWDSFSINAGELTQFLQPGTNAAVLNRVTGGDPSAIHGALKANGNVFVINPNGILVGPSGTIDVHGLVLSTLDVSNGEFLARGDMAFKGNAQSGGVTNMGRINAIGGDVFLIGRTVTNTSSVTASGRVGMAAGEEVLLTAGEGANGERMFVRATGSGASGVGIANDGTIEGAAVELKAHGNVYALAINNKGSVRAVGSVNEGGRVYLRGVGGSVENTGSISATRSISGNAGQVLIDAAYAKVDGQIRAEAGSVRVQGSETARIGGEIDVTADSGHGGDVVVEGRSVEVGSAAIVDASGDLGGGSVRIGGGFQGKDATISNAETLRIDDGAVVRADALASGDAGSVILWADGETTFRGDVSAQAFGSGDGGFVEVSGRDNLLFDGTVSTASALGQTGTLLLDPTNLTVSTAGASANNVNVNDLITALGSNSVVISTQGAGTDTGHINVNNAVTYDSANALTFLAHGDIRFNASVQNSGSGAIAAAAGWDGSFYSAGALPMGTGSVTITSFIADPTSYGQNGGSVRIGSSVGTQRVAVGSRGGDTLVLGHGLYLTGGSATDAAAQLGYRPTAASQATSGDIGVYVRSGGVTLQAGTGSATFAQIGHGGRSATSVTSGPLSGNIWIESTAAGDLKIMGGSTADFSAAFIGHGGMNYKADKVGKIDIRGVGDVLLQAGDFTNAFAQIGHVNARTGGNTVQGSDGSGNPYFSDIYIDASGKVELIGSQGGGTSSGRYAQIGHGGILGTGTIQTGDITVKAGVGKDVVLKGGIAQNSYAVIGHGGRSNAGDHTGNISVLAGGSILASAGSGERSGVMIGHGLSEGNNSNPAGNSGTIDVRAEVGDIIFLGGTGTQAWAQIGHGSYGNNGDHNGAITVVAPEGSIEFRWLNTGSASDVGGPVAPGNQSYVQLGHGGPTAKGAFHGDIQVLAGKDVIFLSSISNTGSRGENYAQLGHGGIKSEGDHTGNITVLANTGVVNIRSGSRGDGDRYAQLGHGGAFSSGSHIGNIAVLSQGNILLDNITTGTVAVRGYVQLGHGGYASLSPNGHTGKISIASRTGTLSLYGATNVSSDSYAQIGHGGLDATGAHDGAILIRTGNQILATAGSGISGDGGGMNSYAQIGHGGGTTGTIAAADYTGTITISAQIAGSFNDIGDFFDEDGNIGPDGKLDAVSLVAGTGGNAIEFKGGIANTSNQYAQLGHGGIGRQGDYTGFIDITSLSSVAFTGGSGTRGYAQLGHGGMNSVATTGHDGNITVKVLGAGSTGSILFNAGIGLESYVQMGHGGLGSVGSNIGDIFATSLRAFRFQADAANSDGYRAYAQIGHGGYGSNGSQTGSITAMAGETDMAFYAGVSNNAVVDGVDDDRYSQLGHGGTGSSGNHTGEIAASAATNIVLKRGEGGIGSYTQFGHGGLRSTATTGHTGRIAAVARTGYLSTTLAAVNDPTINSYIQFGHGGGYSQGNHNGDIILRSADYMRLYSYRDVGSGSYVQAGHGGLNSPGSHLGDITLTSAIGGTFTDIGDFDGDGTFDSINVTDGNNAEGLLISAGNDNKGHADAYAQVGHGGSGSPGVHEGDIYIDSKRQIRLLAGLTGERNYAQIGHGGYDAAPTGGGTTKGDIFVRSVTEQVDLRWTAANSKTAEGTYIQIGHGGFVSSSAAAGNALSGAIEVIAGTDVLVRSVTGNTSLDNYAQIGHGGVRWQGSRDGDISVAASGNITLTGGTTKNRYAQIGHGGANGSGTVTGDIFINYDSVTETALAAGNITVDARAGTDETYAQIGHGGTNYKGDRSGDITIGSAGNLNLLAGSSKSYAQIGHGGSILTGGTGHGDLRGEIQILESTSITMTGEGLSSYVQIGHGGELLVGEVSDANITIKTSGNLKMQGGSANNAYAQIGHGGRGSGGNHEGNISVDGFQNLDLKGGSATSTYAQIGNGGNKASSQILEGEIILQGTGTVNVAAGSGAEAYAQIGNGGINVKGTMWGGIRVMTDGGLSVVAGGGGANENTYAQIGHGGAHSAAMKNPNPPNILDGDICVQLGGQAEIESGEGAGTYAMIGHGGRNQVADRSGDITVVTGLKTKGGVSVTTGGGAIASRFAQIGHGVSSNELDSGSITGNVTVVADNGGDIVVNSVTTNTHSAAIIGHGGASTYSTNVTGGLSVFADGNITATGSVARIAHINRAVAPTNYIAGPNSVGYQIVANGTVTATDAQLGGVAAVNTFVNANVSVAPVRLTLTNAIDITINAGSQINAGSGNDLAILTGGNITVNRGYQNTADGNVLLVAGWNGGSGSSGTGNWGVSYGASGADYCNPEVFLQGTNGLADCGDFGTGNKTVTIGSATQTNAVRVGSRQGLTLVAGYGLTLNASTTTNDSASQLGFYGDGSGDSSGAIEIGLAAGGLALNAGSRTGAYAQIGHGGLGSIASNTSSSATITISFCSPGDIVLHGAAATNAYAQIGHGGKSVGGNREGDISVSGFNNLELKGGANTSAYAQIGNGGRGATGSEYKGDIELKGEGQINVTAGAGGEAYTQIGNGGMDVSGTMRGDIHIATDKDLSVEAGGGGTSANTYAHIGHGGVQTSSLLRNTLDGDICIQLGGQAEILSGEGIGTYAMIGHGGRGQDADRSGDIAVVTGLKTTGGVLVKTGASDNASHFAQIGHGVSSNAADNGTIAGNVTVVADRGGDIAVTAVTTNGHSAAIIGHGGNSTTSTNVTGGLSVFADGNITATGALARIAHISRTTAPSNYSAGLNSVGYQIVANGTVTATDAQLGGAAAVNTFVNANIGSAPVRLTLKNAIDITVNADSQVNTDAGSDLVIMTGGSITMNRGYQNNSNGNVILVAGWNGGAGAASTDRWGVSYGASGADYCNPELILQSIDNLVNCGEFGIGNKAVTIGSTTQANAVRVGSRQGLTFVAGYGLTMNASTSAVNSGTQLGFYGDNSGDASGEIDVRLRAGGLALNSGSQESAYTQIGHGGLDSTAGNTTTSATITISFCEPGDVKLSGGTNTSAYAQIGHGGRRTTGTRNGAISVVGFKNLTMNSGNTSGFAYTQIGHGGSNSNFGSITNATITLSGTGNAALTSMGTDGHAMIGHGGNSATGSVTNSGIFLDMGGGIAITAGNQQKSFAQIGHGGHAALNLPVVDSIIRINQATGTGTGDIVIQGGNTNSHAMIGHGGSRADGDIGKGNNSASGNIEILHAKNVRVLAGNNTDGVAQIGHGGERSPGTHSGNITVYSTGDIELKAGSVGNFALAMIGHGGTLNRGVGATDPSGAKSGNITLDAGGSLLMEAGSGAQGMIAQVGHGGLQNRGAISGNIFITTRGGTTVKGGSSTNSYAMIGHGGQSGVSNTAVTGSITVNSGGKVSVLGGSGLHTYAMIGHGGNAYVSNLGLATEAITVVGNLGIDLIGGTTSDDAFYGASAQIGHGGYDSVGVILGDIYLNYDPLTGLPIGGGNIHLDGGDGVNGTYARVGHGGRRQSGDKTGDIIIGKAGNLLLEGGRSDNFAQIGHGGNAADANIDYGIITGDIRILDANSVTLTGGAERSYAQIGHGGYRLRGEMSGDVAVIASGNISVGGPTSGNGTDAYVQIGHGGRSGSGETGGNIEVRAGKKVLVQGGNALDSSAVIGHGGKERANDQGKATDKIVVIGDEGISVVGGSTNVVGLYAQIGSGGYNTTVVSTMRGDIYLNYDPWLKAVAGGGDIEVRATSGGNGSYAQVGHGGRLNNGDKFGEIVLGKMDQLIIEGGSGSNTTAQVGHGGYDSENGGQDGNIEGEIWVLDAQSIRLQGGDGATSYALLGHGGYLYDGTVSKAKIDISVSGNIDLTGGNSGTFSSAQIGHGGPNSMNMVVDNVDIKIQGGGSSDITFTPKGSNTYAQIGHGGARSDGNANYADKSGNISVKGIRNIKMTGGTAVDAYAQIGHGGEGGTTGTGIAGMLTGSIDVEASGDLLMQAGKHDATYVQIGHIGGKMSAWSADGAVTVAVGGSLTLSGGDTAGSNNYAQIGHGGVNATGTRAGAITLTAGKDVSLTGGTRAMSYAKVGHGGSGSQGAMSGAVTVEGNNILLNGSTGTDSSAQIGHGGTGIPAGATVVDAAILVNAIGKIDVFAGAGAQAYAQIGHGGFNTQYLTTENSDISINEAIGTGTGDISLRAGSTGANSFAMIGHGGSRTDGNVGGDISSEGDIKIHHADNIIIEGGTGTDNFTQIGHGGERGQGLYQGDIWINASRNLTLLGGGTLTRTFARLGHGGHTGGADQIGDIWIQTGGDISLQGAATSTQAFVQIGHGGVDTTGDASGALHIVSGGDLDIVGGTGPSNYALLGHGGGTTAGAPTAGVRKGDVLMQIEGNTTINDGESYAYLTHIGAAGVSGSSRLALITGTLDTTASASGVTEWIRNMLPTGSVEVGVRNGDLIVQGAMAQVASDHHIDLFSTGDVILRTTIQSSGQSDITVLGGWDGTSGLVSDIQLTTSPLIKELSLDGTTASWGDNDGSVYIGDGTQTVRTAVGSSLGTTRVAGYQVTVQGSHSNSGANAQVGSIALSSVSPTGDIVVDALEGGVTVAGGDAFNASAQIGHRSFASAVVSMAGNITVETPGKLSVTGGGTFSSAQIGHGGSGAAVGAIHGDVVVKSAEDLEVLGGDGNIAYAQIGHGGAMVGADMDGAVIVETKGDLTLKAPNLDAGAYAKLGHGDDLRGAFGSFAEDGLRDGAVKVSAAGDIVMESAQIGHVGSESPAILGANAATYIAVSRVDPADPAGGSLIADEDSEFSGSDLRIYLPRRENNQVTAGAMMGGEEYDGVKDPWPTQEANEYANYVQTLAGDLQHPAEHDNSMGSGPAPVQTFAFYYDLIELAPAPYVPPVIDPTNPVTPPVGPVDPRPRWGGWLLPDDWSYEDWLRAQQEEYSRLGKGAMYYEGYRQYGTHGESIYTFDGFDAK